MANYKIELMRINRAQAWAICILVTLTILTGCAANQLEHQANVASAKLSLEAQGYKADLQELSDRIKAEHPRPFRFITEMEFDKLVAARISDIKPKTTKRDFIWAFSEVLSAIECGHSRLPYFNQENALIADEERLPLDLRFVGDRLFVFDPLTNADQLNKGDEIATINGRDVKDLRAEIFRHIQSEGVAPHSKVYALNVYANSYMTYALGFPPSYTLTRVGENAPLKLQPLDAFSFKPLFHPNAPCQDQLCYRVDDDSNAGIMTMHTFAFYGDQSQVFADYVDTSLQDIVENNRSALIMDIRFHDGGSGYAGAYVLRRLAKSPFAYFEELSDKRGPSGLFEVQHPVDVGLNVPVFLLVDGNTVSSAPHFAALFKEHKMGTLVGEPMGGNKSTNDGKTSFTSTAHGIEYTIARMRFEVDAPSQPLDEAVQPDIVLTYKVGDVLNGEDSMMERVISLAAD